MEQLFELAMDQARLAMEDGSIPVGGVIAGPDLEVLSVGRNRLVSGDMSAHAEIDTIREGGRLVAEPRDWIMVTTAEPCLMCVGAVLMCEIRTLVWLSASFLGSAWDATVRSGYRPELVSRVRVVREPSETYRRSSRAILHDYYVRIGDDLKARLTVD